jgi:signal transduction histidine kinase
MLRLIKRWSLTAVGVGAVGVVVGYSFVSTDSFSTTLVKASSPLFLSVLVAAAGIGIGHVHDADFVASVALWSIVSATVGVAINQWYVFLLGGAFPDDAFYFTMSSVSVTAAFGTATGYYYTALRRKADELVHANSRLRDRNQRLDEFASVISHDLRNPLNVARGQLRLAQEEGGEHFEKVERAHGRMNRLIEEVLSFVRQGEEVYDPEWVDLNGVAERAVGNSPLSNEAAEVESRLEVRADRDRLERMFENLFRNAVEHAGEEAKVKVGTDGGCIFYVEDDGPGIPPDEREHVFEGGYSTKENGTGFGLPMVRRTAEVHGWSVKVEESNEGGARFRFADKNRG